VTLAERGLLFAALASLLFAVGDGDWRPVLTGWMCGITAGALFVRGITGEKAADRGDR
jgi:hypothetical protein